MSFALAMPVPGLRPGLRRWAQAIVGVIAALALQLTTALPAQADAFSEVIKVMRVIDQVAPHQLPFTADDLQNYHDLILNCASASSTDDVLNCIDAAASSGAGQQAGIPWWLPKMINVYFDIEHHDYWGLVADAGEAVACAGAELMTGVDVCGAIEAIADAAKDVADAAVSVADAVSQFFSDLGSDLQDLGNDVYCLFASCGGSPPPPTAIDTANNFCASRGGLQSLLSHTGAVDDVSLICNDGTKCIFRPGKAAECITPAQEAALKAQKEAQNNLDFATQPQHWAAQFEAKWLPQCLDDQCRIGVRFIRTGIVALAQQRHAADPDYPWAFMGLDFLNADKQAQENVLESQNRNARNFAVGPQQWAAQFEAKWIPQCADDQCRLGVRFVKAGILALAQQRHNANSNYPWAALQPDLDNADKQAQQIIAEGRARNDQAIAAGTQQWAAAFEARWLPKCPDETCPAGIKLVRLGAVLHVQQEHDADPLKPFSVYTAELAGADKPAQQVIDDAWKRVVAASKSRAFQAPPAAAAPRFRPIAASPRS